MGHIRGTSRCARRGSASLTPLAKALAKFGFFAPLTEDVFLDKGYGAASFTRATTATVKDHEGAIRNCLSGEVRFHGQRRVRNWLAVPEDFSSATWTTIAGGTGTVPTKTANYASAPDGTTTACRVQATVSAGTASGDYSLMRQAATYAGTGAVGSVWMKSNTGASQVVIVSYDEVVAVTVTTSWQRFSWPRTVGSNHFDIGCRGDSAANKTVDVLVWHPQMEALVGASNQNPSEYVSVGANKLNELLYTDEITNVAWVKGDVTAAAVVEAGPVASIGSICRLTETATSASHGPYLGAAAIPVSALVASAYLKKDTADYGGVCLLHASGAFYSIIINLTTGAVTDTEVSALTATSYAVTDAGNGWWRVEVFGTTGTQNTCYSIPFLSDAATAASWVGGRPSYAGSTARKMLVCGVQLAKSSVSVSYFPVGSVYPYHGACVDGVKYFDTENGNTVASNVVTEATGAAITRPENDGLTNGLVLPGVAGNYASAPDSAAISITGDIEIQIKVRLSDYTPGSNTALVTKHETAGQKSFNLWIATTGILVFAYSPDGTATIPASASAATGVTDGDITWFKTTFVSATGKVNFYKSTDGSAWSAIGVEQTIASGSIFNGTDILRIGSGAANATIDGTVYRTVIKSGIDGTTVFDADFTAQELGATSFTESSANAATVTVNRSGTVPAYIGNPLRLFNYDGYLAESARTNLVLQSSNFGTSWSFTGTPTRSAAAAYCGEIALDLIGDDDAGAQEGYRQDITFTGDATKSVSFLVKQGTSTSSIVQLLDTIAAADRLAVAVTWSGGVPVCTYATGSAERASEYMGGGVWRIFCLSTSVTAANTNSLRFYPAKTVADALTPTGDVYIGGVQAENYPNASASHIPTTTATVTRNADFLSYPLAGNISESLGAMYAELATHSSQVGNYAGLMGNNATRVFNWQNGAQFTDGTAATNAAGGSVWTPPQSPSKAACSWSASGNSKVAVSNGVLSTLNLTYDGTINFGTSLEIGARAAGAADCMEGIVRNARAALVKPTDADLQLITA